MLQKALKAEDKRLDTRVNSVLEQHSVADPHMELSPAEFNAAYFMVFKGLQPRLN